MLCSSDWHNHIKPMLLQKTLHMSQSLEECKNRLASIHSYRSSQIVLISSRSNRGAETST